MLCVLNPFSFLSRSNRQLPGWLASCCRFSTMRRSCIAPYRWLFGRGTTASTVVADVGPVGVETAPKVVDLDNWPRGYNSVNGDCGSRVVLSDQVVAGTKR